MPLLPFQVWPSAQASLSSVLLLSCAATHAQLRPTAGSMGRPLDAYGARTTHLPHSPRQQLIGGPCSRTDLGGLHDTHSLKAQVAPPLSDLCVQVLAANFSNRPTLRGIPTRYIGRITELLPTSLPVEVSGPLIDDEQYWKRCALERWENCQIVDHGSSWKRLYFERNLTDFLEAFDPTKVDTEELQRTLAVSKDYIFSLKIKQASGTERHSGPFLKLRGDRSLRPGARGEECLGAKPHAAPPPSCRLPHDPHPSGPCRSFSRTSTWKCCSRTCPRYATSI